MPTVLLCLAISSILCTQSAVAAPNGRLVVATPQRGEFYFHGVLVPPPYSIAVGYNIQFGDTIWHGLYINNIALHPEPIPLSAEGRVDSLRREAMKLAIRTSEIPSGTPPAKTAQMLAAAYARILGLVDSARAVSETALVIYWTGSPAPDWRPLSGKPFQQPEEPTKSLVLEARDFGSSLGAGMAVLATTAGGMTIPAARVHELHEEVADIRKGVVRKYSILQDDRRVAEFRNPRPLPTRRDQP